MLDRVAGNERSGERLAELLSRRPRQARIALLCDTRPMHRYLAAHGARAIAGPLGRYRRAGEEVSVRGFAGDAAARQSTTCGNDVEAEMSALAWHIASLAEMPPAPLQCRRRLASVFARFQEIQPYQDGNGRVGRLLVRGLADLIGLPLSPRWTVDRAGYGSAMSVALKAHRRSPRPLQFYFDRYFP